MVRHAEYEANHIVACYFTNEIVLPALKLAQSCQTVKIVHFYSEQKVIPSKKWFSIELALHLPNFVRRHLML